MRCTGRTPPSADNPIERTLVLTTQAGPFVLFVLSGCLLYGPFAGRDLFWMLHVWLYRPGPEGMFAGYNSAVRTQR